MTVLVTGGSGLVGSHIIEALRSRGMSVRALVRAPGRRTVEALGAEAVIGDVTDPEAWRRAAGGVRAIVHAAALVAQHVPYDTFEAVNVGGTRQAIAAARAGGARLVHISSVAVYGRGAAYRAGREGRRITEDSPCGEIEPHDSYARVKRLAEAALWEETSRGGVWAVALRPNVIYGERDRLFSPKVVRAVRLGLVAQIGPGTNRLSCVYAGNVAAAVVAALEADVPAGRAYNVTNDGGLTQREFVDAFADALGTRLWRIRIPFGAAAAGASLVAVLHRLRRPGAYVGIGDAAVQFIAGDNPFVSDRARAELGWRPPVQPREAIRRTVQWFMNEKPGR
ncbi:MAG: NAD-dependent epimerase/dehydratase family protein [Gemmatimonadetes bacterium]|nr:NAD-dependent epimerase/dehydratase family protein [Gemmatimonadota bacterium]